MKKFLVFLLAVALLIAPSAGYAQGGNATPYANNPRFGNVFPALVYGQWLERASGGGGTAGTTYSLTMPRGYVNTTGGGASFVPYSTLVPITVGIGTVQETVTPTAVSGCGPGVITLNQCTVTAAFTYAHGVGTPVQSASKGVNEAALVAWKNGGGQVEIDAPWFSSGGTAALITAAPVLPNVSILDESYGVSRNWNATPTGLSVATPTTLTAQAACDSTHQFCSDANVVGSASWGGTVYGCVSYVDIMGNEGPCSATASFTSVASKAIDVAAPAASAGAVGYVVYLSLSAGSYALAYQVPSTSLNCTLTTLETATPACAVANTTYGQAASTFGADALFNGGSQIGTYPVNTAMLYPVLATTAQTITAQHPMTNSSLTYSYAPGSRVGACGTSSINTVQLAAAGGISGSSATTVPQPLGSWTIPANCFNYIGAEFRVSGKFTYTDGGSGTSTKVIVSWDSNATNTASVPTPLCSILDTFTSVAGADNVTWSCTVKILTTGASGTALVNGISVGSIAAGQTTLVRSAVDNAVAPSAAIDLITNARISAQFQATGATSNPGAQTLEASLEWLN